MQREFMYNVPSSAAPVQQQYEMYETPHLYSHQ